MCRLRLFSILAILALGCMSLLSQTGCTGSAATQPLSQNQMRATAVFESKVLSDAENRLMDGFDAGLLDRGLHDDLDPYVKSARASADQLTTMARTPGTTQTAFNLVLDQFFAALGPIAQANAKAAEAKHMPATQPVKVKDLGLAPRALRASPPSPSGYVPPSAVRGYDASQFNRR